MCFPLSATSLTMDDDDDNGNNDKNDNNGEHNNDNNGDDNNDNNDNNEDDNNDNNDHLGPLSTHHHCPSKGSPVEERKDLKNDKSFQTNENF